MDTMRRLAAVATGVVMTGVALGGPILPPGEYIPDGEPRVFGDRVYLYGSHDRAHSQRFCDYLLKVWSAPLSDLLNWRDEGISFATRDQPGHPDDVPWSDNELYAPDVVEKGGKYYLYAYIVGAPAAVAVSDTPAGPFKLVSRIVAPPGAPADFGGWGQYADPGVLVDTDGKVYLYWGYLRSAMAQLNPENMFEILPDTFQWDIIPKEKPFNFFEAASPRKIGDTYYLIYADGGILVYATSDQPTGPFKYGGYIIHGGRDYPGGNNHGSLAQINGQWYIFYHRMTNNTIYSRIACVERVTIEPDGSIKEVEMTSLGFREALDPFETTSAHVACVLTGGSYISEVGPRKLPVIRNKAGCVIGFKYFEFESGERKPTEVSVEVRGWAGAGGAIEVWVGKPGEGVKLGEVGLAAEAGDAEEWRTITVPIAAPPAGRHAVYFRYVSADRETPLGDFAAFRFGRR